MGKALEHQNHELIILNRIAEALNREVDLKRSLEVVLANIVELFDLETGWIYIRDEQSGKFYVAATLGLPPALANYPRRMGGTCYCIDSYIEGDMEGAANINAITCSRLKDLKKGTEGLLYHASIPLYAQDKQLGILNVASTHWQELSDNELRLLHTVGDLMSIAIERTRLFQRSAEMGAINERNRIAREIHDTIAQGLSALALQLETADLLLENDSPKEKIHTLLQNCLSLTRANLEEARRSVLDLRAVPLEGKTLFEAVQELLDAMSISSKLEVIGSSPPLPIRIASSLYRIAQEALTNVQRHAHAKKVRVKFILMPERVKIVVEDDGTGFDLQQVQQGHFGLIGLRERARLLNGQIDIASAIGNGTIIEVNLPLDTTHDS